MTAARALSLVFFARIALSTQEGSLDGCSICIVGFPCRQFGNQEFADPKKIREFAEKHNSNFEIMEMTDVNGANTHPVFLYCKWNAPPDAGFVNMNDLTTLGPIGWNFGKFLVDRNGGICNYYGPSTHPSDMEEDIRKAIKGELPGFRRNADGQPVEGALARSAVEETSKRAKN
ncbi:hypothetical protein Esti_006504 [Eimeria stiedai]